MGDYIKREDAIRAVRAFIGLNEDERQWAIEDIPSADVVKVRHGRWEGDFYECSVCGFELGWSSTYCPHCGARMDGKEQEHDVL